MFAKLHKKILTLHLLIISAVLLVAFIGIFTITCSNLYADAKQDMQQLLQSPQLTLTHSAPPQKKTDALNQPKGFAQSFKIFFKHDDTPISYSSFLIMNEETYRQALDSIQPTQVTGFIYLNDKIWLYEKQFISDYFAPKHISSDTITKFPATTHYQIAFLDITQSIIILRDLSLTLLGISGAMFFIVLAISYYFAKQAIRPIEEAFEKQQQFISDASHELKTPLAIISANTDALIANQKDTIINQIQWLNYIHDQTQRMNTLITNLLTLAKNDHATMPTPTNATICSNLLLQTLSEFEVLSFEKGLVIHPTIHQDISLYIHPATFKQLCYIFLDNALKYTTTPGYISINFTKEKQTAVLTFSNSFPTLTQTEVNRLFDRFYRGDSAREYTGSYGLGLSIAQQIITQHQGEIHATSTNNILSFTIQFPLA
ncbi:MAG: sensor histidine kinase [Culicoidibacterales bacterium]